MPYAPRRPCRHPGCPDFCEPGQVYCKNHMEFSHDRMRGNNVARGYGTRWKQARKVYLQRHPLCARCLSEGRYTPATVVDHIIPHRGDEKLFWDEGNWQSLCAACHNQKTGHGL